MIANYVKQGYVRNPVKKQYDAEQIARLTVIALVKNVLSMENIGKLFRYCQESTTLTESYDLFCAELEEQLRHLYDGTELPQRPQGDALDLLHSVVTACANVLYLNSSFDKLTFPPEEPKSK